MSSWRFLTIMAPCTLSHVWHVYESREHRSNTASSSGSEGKPSSKHGAALETTLQSLQNRAQGLIDKINEERAKDQELMKSFNESLSMKVSEISQRLEDRMYNLYNQHNQLLQERMQELPEVIERIEVTHSELQAVCETIFNLYRKLSVHPENSQAKDLSF
uniref:Synaptonemal complex central element protein 2 n=1 Tax=Leptobrachium leishanense TaxID=445787 RepID=A0A8C5LTZ4_9ANUR